MTQEIRYQLSQHTTVQDGKIFDGGLFLCIHFPLPSKRREKTMPGQPLVLSQCMSLVVARGIITSQSLNAGKNREGCILYRGSRNTDGYGQVQASNRLKVAQGKTGKEAYSAYLIHRVAFYAHFGTDAQQQVSHRCNQPACFNVDHLVDESDVLNNARKKCPGNVDCPWHSHPLIIGCSHKPPCIRILGPDEEVHCCLHNDRVARDHMSSDPAGLDFWGPSSLAPGSSQ